MSGSVHINLLAYGSAELSLVSAIKVIDVTLAAPKFANAMFLMQQTTSWLVGHLYYGNLGESTSCASYRADRSFNKTSDIKPTFS